MTLAQFNELWGSDYYPLTPLWSPTFAELSSTWICDFLTITGRRF